LFNNIFQSIMDVIFAEIINGLISLFNTMDSMGANVLELPWVAAIIVFFRYLGWTLFLAGLAMAVFDAIIESQNGKPAIRDLSLNLIKGFLAVSLFTVLPVELFKFCVSLSGDLGRAITSIFQGAAFDSIGTLAAGAVLGFLNPLNLLNNLLFIIMIGYCVIKVFFANVKRGGILLINLAVGSLYMLSIPRGYMDGFHGWCKQVAALCLTQFLQTTILIAGLLTFSNHALAGMGLMLAAGEVPRIAERFGLDSSVKVNFMSSYYAVNSMVNMAKGVARAVAK
jgi:hypothetical protein